MLLLDRSCVIVGFFLKYYVPQQWHPSQVYFYISYPWYVFQHFPTITQDLSRRSITTSGKSVSMYPRRPKAKALSNAVDVVERLRDPTDQVQNARHLRDLHTFSSVASLELLIQLRLRESSVSTTAW